MRIFLQHSDPIHRATLATLFAAMGDEVHEATNLEDLSDLTANHAIEGIVLEHSEDAAEWIAACREHSADTRAVFLAAREDIGRLAETNPPAAMLPLPGTAMAIRVSLSEDAAADPACAVGDFQFLDVVALGSRTHVFEGIQSSIERPVSLRLLNAEFAADPESVASFIEDARAKAAITHDRIGTVYQAFESDRGCFYAAERIDGPDLATHAAASEGSLSVRLAADILATTASSLLHLENRGLSAHRIEPRHIHLVSGDLTPRIENLAVRGATPSGHHAALLQHIAAFVLPLIDTSADDPEASALHTECTALLSTPPENVDIESTLRTLRSLLNRRTARHTARHRPGTPVRSGGGSALRWIAVAAVAAVAVIAAVFLNQGATEPSLARQIADLGTSINLSGGSIEHPRQGVVDVEPYSLDKYEVSIAEYRDFLTRIKTLDEEARAALRHPEQPDWKTSHQPENWDEWFPIAQEGGRYLNAPLTLECPVFNVDFWDAWAYSRWLRRTLPSEIQWEAAALDNSALPRFPWGDSPDTPANTRDHPRAAEGFLLWSPVDLPEVDTTRSGIRNLGGNVSEWTTCLTVHPEDPDKSIPVVKGGSFAFPSEEAETLSRRKVLSRDERHPWLGFRTAGRPGHTTAHGNPPSDPTP